jgi:hypothetical protein
MKKKIENCKHFLNWVAIHKSTKVFTLVFAITCIRIIFKGLLKVKCECLLWVYAMSVCYELGLYAWVLKQTCNLVEKSLWLGCVWQLTLYCIIISSIYICGHKKEKKIVFFPTVRYHFHGNNLFLSQRILNQSHISSHIITMILLKSLSEECIYR